MRRSLALPIALLMLLTLSAPAYATQEARKCRRRVNNRYRWAIVLLAQQSRKAEQDRLYYLTYAPHQLAAFDRQDRKARKTRLAVHRGLKPTRNRALAICNRL